MAVESCETSSLLLSDDNREEGTKCAIKQPAANSGASRNITAALLPVFLTQEFKIFKRKGVILVLLWSLSSNIVYYFLTSQGTYNFLAVEINPSILVASSVLLYPLLGWLADVYFSRYRVIKWFLRIMWLVSILFCLVFILLDYFSLTNKSVDTALSYLLYISLTVGLGGFQANIIQFGADQLVDASSSEISSFITWYTWVWLFSEIPVLLTKNCVCEDSFKSIPLLLLPLCLTVSVSSDYVYNSCLVKEPPSSNPLTLIYKVLQYAAKNKYPRLRSAFTYCEDKRLSRIDLGKSKYGGPFTTEEVENVKIFWRLFGIIIIGSIFTSLIICTYPATDKIHNHLQGGYGVFKCRHYGKCIRNIFFWKFGSVFGILLLPIYEFILQPFLRNYFHRPIKSKFLVGMLLFFVGIAGYITIEGVGRHLTQHVHYYSNMTCPIDNYHGPSVTLSLNGMWILIPNTFNGIAKYLFLLGTVKFAYAQSPYSMKGLILGLIYGCAGLFIILSFVLLLLVQYAIKKWLPHQYGCEMWYLLFIFMVLLVITSISYFVLRFYKMRFRDDDLENEQMFAIHYYSQGND